MLEKVRATIVESLGVDAEEVKEDTVLTSLCGDSLEAANLILDLEDTFNISIDDPENVLTVRDAVERAEKK